MAEPAYDNLLSAQHGVATRSQLRRHGWTEWQIEAQVQGGRWRLLNEHVVVTHNGPLTRIQRVWAVDLSAPGLHGMAGLTAMQMWGVTGFETDTVQMLVPRGGHVLPVADVIVEIHESRRFVPEDVVVMDRVLALPVVGSDGAP